MKKYLLIAHKYGKLKRGAHLTSQRLVNHFPEYLDYKTDLDAQDLEKLNEEYNKLIFVTQVLSVYCFQLNINRLKQLNYVLLLRGDQNPLIYNSGNNGFHYYRMYKNIKFFIPFVTDFPKNKKKQFKKPILGFYIRRDITPDSLTYTHSFLKDLKMKVDIFVMGNPAPELLQYNSVANYTHTYDNIEFFNNITHYIYPASKVFRDPFPNSVLEAIQSNIQIVFPEIPNRIHKDGIDDIKDCIKWHKTFNPDIMFDNTNCILKNKNFRKFYLRLFDNDFEYEFDREKYKNFYEWIEKEVM